MESSIPLQYEIKEYFQNDLPFANEEVVNILRGQYFSN